MSEVPAGGAAVHYVQADMLGKRTTQAIRMKQLDNRMRYLKVQLVNDEEAFSIPEGAHVRLRGLKPDGKGAYLDAVEFAGDTATFEINANFLAVNGKMPCEVEVSLGDDLVKSRTFFVEIEKEALPSGAVVSSDEYPALLAAAEAAKKSQLSAAQSEENAASSAKSASASEDAARKAAQEAGEAASQVINAQVEEKLTEMRQIDVSVQKNKTDAQTAADTAVNARNLAQQAQAGAQAAQTAAQTAKTAAETAQGKAETAQGKAEDAAASAAEYAGLSKGAWYGVEFSGSTSGTRTGAAKDFVFTPATDTSEGQNDFDAVYPWAGMRRCCCTLNSDGTVKVNAYKGQPGYIEDGTNGEVLVEVPLFYVKGMVDVDPQISMLPLPGFLAPRKFRNADGSLKQRCYLRAFPGYVGSDGKLHSIAGVVPSGNKTISAFLAAARQWGEKYCIGTSADVEVMLYLMIVVYGTRNAQAKINGCVSLYATNIAITSAAESANTVTTAAGTLQVGDVISIGTGGENESVAYRRIVTAVDGAVATFDGDPVTTTTNHKVWRIMQATGTANDVLGTCGSRVSNSDGKHSFIFYGLENPLYGNQWRFECDWKLIDGVPYYCDDPTKYQWTSATDYTKLDTLTLPGEGWAVSLQADERAPWLQITAAVGGSSGTYLADYFYINKSGVRIVLRGATSNDGGRAGPFDVYLYYDASLSGWGCGGDLSIPG